MIDVEVRMQIEKKLSIPETKDNIQIMSFCGWVVLLSPDESVTLKCACCQRMVPLEIIKLITDEKNQASKFVFNPLTFHYGFCYFSPQYS